MTKAEIWERICIRQNWIWFLLALFALTLWAAIDAPNFTTFERIAIGVVTIPAFIAVIIHEDVRFGLLWIGIPMSIGMFMGLPLLTMLKRAHEIVLWVSAGSIGGLIMMLAQRWIQRRFPSTRAS